MPYIQSSPHSAFPSLTHSLGGTEDLYCDDELHPSLENDPNMRLYTENRETEHHPQHFLDIGDEGKEDYNCVSIK